MLKTILRIAVLGDIDCIVKGPQEACKGVKVLDRLDYYYFFKSNCSFTLSGKELTS